MKKIKHILAVLIRLLIVFVPGIVTVSLLCGTHGWPVSLLAALGVECIIGVIVAFSINVAGQYKARREIEKEKAEAQTPATEK